MHKHLPAQWVLKPTETTLQGQVARRHVGVEPRLPEDSNPVVLCGDLNIAHNENDIWNPTGNRGTSGFLDHEREWFDRLLKSGWKDLVRSHYGERKGPYSWWSNRGRARELDRGWRIDYILANQAASKQFVSAEVVREGGLSISDHAPVMADFSEDGH